MGLASKRRNLCFTMSTQFSFMIKITLRTSDRFLMLGLSNESRVLLVCHCERADGEVIRIISARKATKTERKHYKGGDQ
jgi:uncharacterized DUF497 family protein